MSATIHLTVLVENSVSARGLKAEHGLAWWIEIGGRRGLFDTGQSGLLRENAGMLGCSLDHLDAIVLSHGHYDHTGGLAVACELAPAAPVCLHPAALAPKFGASTEGQVQAIGMPEAARLSLSRPGRRVVLTTQPTEILPRLWVTGEIPRRTDFEDVGGRFFLDPQGQQPDPLVDDQAVFFCTADGVVVVLGCAHAGVVNTLEHVRRLTHEQPLHAVLGGMHLLQASPQRLAATVAALRQSDVKLLAPCHCTGAGAVARLWAEFPGRCVIAGVGTRFVFRC